MRLIVGTLLILLGACSPADIEHAVEAVFLALDIASGPQDSFYKSWKLPPDRMELAYTVEGRSYVADLYRPTRARGALVLVPGLHRDGRHERNLMSLATTLGRAGYVVLVPDLPNYRLLRIGAEDPVGVADGARYLIGRKDLAGPIGIAGISYASGPAVLAATEPDIADRIAFVFALGGYYDLDDVLIYLVTAQYRDEPGSPWRTGSPNAYGSWLFVHANAGRLTNFDDRRRLEAVAERRMADPRAPIDDLVQGFSAEGRSVMALLGEPDPSQVPRRIRDLPSAIRHDFDALTLSGKPLERLKAHAILLHGEDDAIVPYTQSVALARAIGEERAELHLAKRLAHVEFKPDSLLDGVEVWRAGLSLLRHRR